MPWTMTALASPFQHPFGSPKFCHAWTFVPILLIQPCPIPSPRSRPRKVQRREWRDPNLFDDDGGDWREKHGTSDFPLIFLWFFLFYTRLPIGITIYLHVFQYIYIHFCHFCKYISYTITVCKKTEKSLMKDGVWTAFACYCILYIFGLWIVYHRFVKLEVNG